MVRKNLLKRRLTDSLKSLKWRPRFAVVVNAVKRDKKSGVTSAFVVKNLRHA